jgi:hypothetical protein
VKSGIEFIVNKICGFELICFYRTESGPEIRFKASYDKDRALIVRMGRTTLQGSRKNSMQPNSKPGIIDIFRPGPFWKLLSRKTEAIPSSQSDLEEDKEAETLVHVIFETIEICTGDD